MNALNHIKNLALSLIAACSIGSLAQATLASPSKPAGNSTQASPAPIRETQPAPSENWVKIDALDSHSYSLLIKGWTVVSLDNANDELLDVFIFDARGNLLESFDSYGCGAFLQLDGVHAITIVVANFQKSSGAYKLTVR